MMFSAEYVIMVMIVCLVVGAVIGAVANEVLVAGRLRRDRDLAESRLNAELGRERARTVHKVHLGTPHRPETVQLAQTARRSDEKPGLRVVDGEVMYSAEWLNELRAVKS